ncbi:MAG: hypothetical protein K2X27_18540 [Candidatus Obscuribacterales bacterium]|nr:hypothetical protein [Candidatus Obscuribacterales bacterium]
MRNWLICLPRADMEHCIKIGKFGLNRKHIMGGIKEGDGVVCCASKDWKILAVGRATSQYYLDTAKVFFERWLVS